MKFVILLLTGILISATPSAASESPLVRSTRSGSWSDPATWAGGKIPSAGDRVQIRPGHTVVFATRIDAPIRSIHVAGTLSIDPDRDTLLTVGLIKIADEEDSSESVLDVHEGMAEVAHAGDRPSLLIGTPDRPIGTTHSAVIRLAEVEGLDPEVCPAIICRGGRMEFHGAPVNPTWTKLAKTAKAGDSVVVLDRSVEGWKVGDRVIVTATKHQFNRNEDQTPLVREAPQTEERILRAIDGPTLTLDAPLDRLHTANGSYRGEVALLSRNVVVESANPAGVRGHTMYHRGSTGSISYAEFRHLGKTGKLGKYSLHFHKVGDTMRGASVIGASIWDSGNRWITIHATNRLVVRDCVGYQSVGHGFFLEDGTEVDNILDGNLAVQATEATPLPGQLLAYDKNDGAGFWWANSRNSFTRNVAVECDAYGFRFEAPTLASFNPVLPIRGADGSTQPTDVRLVPFLRFDANEAHSQRRYGVNLGGGSGKGHPADVEVVGPDSNHPFVIRGLLIWDAHWAFTPAVPGLMVDGLELAASEFGFWKPDFHRQAYRGLKLYQCGKTYSDIRGPRPDPSSYPSPLEPVDDRPPVSVILRVEAAGPDRIRVIGCSSDDRAIKAVRVNGQEARAVVADFSRWERILDWPGGRPIVLKAEAEDASGLVERMPHELTFPERSTGRPAPESHRLPSH